MTNIIITEDRVKAGRVMKKANVVRICYAALFFFTSFVNLNLAINSPEVIKGLSDTTWVPYLGDMIAAMPLWIYALSLYSLAVYQFMLAVLLSSRGIFVQLGMLGGIVFFLFILPFGTFSLPTIPLMIPLLILVDQDYERSIPGMIAARFKK